MGKRGMLSRYDINNFRIFSKLWGKIKTLTQRREAAKIFKEKDSLLPDFASKLKVSLRLCAFALKKVKAYPEGLRGY